MSLLDFLLLLLVAGICGSLAQSIAGYSHRGFLTSIALGFVGALFGSWLARSLGLGEVLPLHVGDRMFPIVWSIIGAALFVTVLHLVRPRTSG
ncbi:MAG TPA: GlsB/YeaQ/YmgE family stress response membrane protein [Candidatus Polarisedimenticolia bacterium]|jgi:uncharacterized membrane protein YeaQ/YmgE (transglycosylase-associated protein family)|nr:GlsB/YeaQ/YmgE family stress response membrane protein [Candidatus Polarisedimenticolia bacterium]